MLRPIRIENWSIVLSGDPYTAPELRASRLVGKVFGHPDFPDGSEITSSAIKELRGGIVRTANRDYVLGWCSPQYRAWANSNQIPLPELA
jgi:hypothetical protein